MVVPTFFNLSLNLAIRSSWSEPQSAPGLVFADCIELLHLWLQRVFIKYLRMPYTKDFPSSRGPSSSPSRSKIKHLLTLAPSSSQKLTSLGCLSLYCPSPKQRGLIPLPNIGAATVTLRFRTCSIWWHQEQFFPNISHHVIWKPQHRAVGGTRTTKSSFFWTSCLEKRIDCHDSTKDTVQGKNIFKSSFEYTSCFTSCFTPGQLYQGHCSVSWSLASSEQGWW